MSLFNGSALDSQKYKENSKGETTIIIKKDIFFLL